MYNATHEMPSLKQAQQVYGTRFTFDKGPPNVMS